MHRRIPDAVWDEIAQHWRAGHMPVTAIAKRYAISTDTIYRHARRHTWPKRDVPRDDTQTAAEFALADATYELKQAIIRLRTEPAEDTPQSARARTALIRECRRGLILYEKATGRTGASEDTDFPDLDVAAAEREVLARLARLDLAELETPALDASAAPPACDPT